MLAIVQQHVNYAEEHVASTSQNSDMSCENCGGICPPHNIHAATVVSLRHLGSPCDSVRTTTDCKFGNDTCRGATRTSWLRRRREESEIQGVPRSSFRAVRSRGAAVMVVPYSLVVCN